MLSGLSLLSDMLMLMYLFNSFRCLIMMMFVMMIMAVVVVVAVVVVMMMIFLPLVMMVMTLSSYLCCNGHGSLSSLLLLVKSPLFLFLLSKLFQSYSLSLSCLSRFLLSLLLFSA